MIYEYVFVLNIMRKHTFNVIFILEQFCVRCWFVFFNDNNNFINRYRNMCLFCKVLCVIFVCNFLYFSLYHFKILLNLSHYESL